MGLQITGMAVSAALTEAFGLTGKLPLQLEESVVPVVSVGNLDEVTYGPAAIGSLAVPADVGHRSEIEISLPWALTTAGAAAIIDRIQLSAAGDASLYSISPSPGMPAPNVFTSQTAWKDTGRRNIPFMLINGKNDAAATAGFRNCVFVRVPANTTYLLELGWEMRALQGTNLQQGIMIRTSADNQECMITAHWRERVPR